MLVSVCFREALVVARNEAKATPIAIGEAVGHTDFKTNGMKSGKLTAYDGDESVVQDALTGETFRWKTEGMVDIKRVYILAAMYLKRLQAMIDVVEVMDMLGVPPADTINAMLSTLTQKGPTPGCTCDVCMKYSQEERNAALAAVTNEQPKAQAAGAVSGMGGDQQFDDLIAQLRTATDQFGAN